MDQSTLDRLLSCYFNQAERKTNLVAGELIFTQNSINDRLYYIVSGDVDGYIYTEDNDRQTKVFTGSAGAFIGVHSFFSETLKTSSSVVARNDVELAWIDKQTKPVEPEYYGPISTQFTPVIIQELSRRQMRAVNEAVAKEEALQKLYTAEQMTTLGQLAAGIAHELNNAIGVLSSKTARIEAVVTELLEDIHPDVLGFFNQGLLEGQSTSSSQVRQRARQLEKDMNMAKSLAKPIAKAIPEGELPNAWVKDPHRAIHYWEIGRDLRDIRLAAMHSVGIVKSVKQLGRTDIDTDEWLDINESINKALALIQSDLRRVSVHISPAELPAFKGSSTELVQIWANILKNACDAMELTNEPEITITTRFVNQRILVTLANNGPEIDEITRRKIFQPNFSTKKGGLSFGLGLGLSIVKRIVSGYGGTIVVKSDAEKTIFRIKLPVEE